MPRWSLIALVVVGVVCAGIGVGLTGAFSPGGVASYGWTAYSPLSGAGYRPIDPTWLVWRSKLGVGLLALGAGTAGAAAVALITTAARHRSETTPNS